MQRQEARLLLIEQEARENFGGLARGLESEDRGKSAFTAAVCFRSAVFPTEPQVAGHQAPVALLRGFVDSESFLIILRRRLIVPRPLQAVECSKDQAKKFLPELVAERGDPAVLRLIGEKAALVQGKRSFDGIDGALRCAVRFRPAALSSARPPHGQRSAPPPTHPPSSGEG